MYLQITTKCNMTCDHCCYSCNKNGKHMDYHAVWHAIDFASKYDYQGISIGGGEPTLHPRFFDILRRCLDTFDYVWMATNGSKTKTMWRLASIIEDTDYENFPDDEYGIEDIANPDDKLTVALSTDPFHDSIDSKIREFWASRARKNYHFELRDVSGRVVNAGRAKRTGVGDQPGNDYGNCPCNALFIRPDGLIKRCGCMNAPIIGSIYKSFDPTWESWMEENDFCNSGCYNTTRMDISDSGSIETTQEARP